MVVHSLPYEKKLVYLTLLFAFVGAAVLSINVGPFALFPFRLLLIPVTLILLGRLVFLPGRAVNARFAVKGFLFFLLAWFVYAALSSLWAVEKVASIRYLIFLVSGMLAILLMVYYFVDPPSLIRFYRLWLVVYAVLVAIGIWEVLTGNHLDVSGYAGIDDVRFQYLPSAIFFNTNDFATYLALSIPLIFVGMRYSRSGVQKLIGAVLLVAGLYVLLNTSSRSNYVAVLLAAACWFVFLQGSRGRLKLALFTGVVLVALLVLVPTQYADTYDLVVERLASISEAVAVGGVRFNLVLLSLQGVLDTGGMGVGAGNAEHYITEYAAETMQITNVHNWWMEILLNFGVWVFVGYVVFYVAVMANLYRVWRFSADRQLHMLSEALLVGLVGFSIGSFSSSSLAGFMPQWMYFGFALAVINSHRLVRRSETSARLNHPL